jgi:hypothetical protein
VAGEVRVEETMFGLLGKFIAAAMLFQDREYVSRSLFRRLTAVLGIAFLLITSAGIVGTRAFPVTCQGLFGRDIPLWYSAIWVALTLWVVVRQLLLLGARLRAAGMEIPYAGAFIYFFGLPFLPAVVLAGLVAPDSEKYLQHRRFLQERSRMRNGDVASGTDTSRR